MKFSTSFAATAILLFLAATAASNRQNIDVPEQTTARKDPSQPTLVLSEEEKMLVRREVFMRGTSTMGLGALFAVGDVPRKVEAHDLPKTVLRKVPQLTGYKYIATENFVAVIDPRVTKVQLVIEDHY
jgi:hypothetical protein